MSTKPDTEKTLADVVRGWLQANGYDGLTNDLDDEGCGCTL
jgi:hypothetical protein